MTRLMNRTHRTRSGVLLLLALGFWATASAAEPFSHEDWARVLEARVDAQGLVDYEGLSSDREALDRYVQRIRSEGPQSTPAAFPGRDHELAYYINAYNALVFDGVLDRGADTESVWSGGLISGYRFFVGMKVRVDGNKTNLRKLENEIIREGYRDPRIHAALNCASIGCPRLPREPFLADTLDAQLDSAIREFVADPRHVRIDRARQTVRISKIFDWFEEDFTTFERERGNTDPRLIDYINRYRESAAQIPAGYSVEILEYDKGLNRQGVEL
ncbi:hypothetical protein ABI59_13965 [Acidobacteria bacterium Mor1]|nr:hypothetical protein ABI59_13965 [Acidobacteria bacterium Mor1]